MCLIIPPNNFAVVLNICYTFTCLVIVNSICALSDFIFLVEIIYAVAFLICPKQTQLGARKIYLVIQN